MRQDHSHVEIFNKNALPSSKHFQLWQLKNPKDVAIKGAKCAEIEIISSPQSLAEEQSPLIFLHGVEYASSSEVVRDLIFPFLSALLQNSSTNFDRPCYFVSWSSSIFSLSSRKKLETVSRAKRFFSLLFLVRKWHKYFSNVERRATIAGRCLAPYVLHWCEGRRIGPTVISHSLGAKVWAEALKHVATNSPSMLRPGIWWNLQPALVRNAFTKNGEYSLVAKLYNGCEHSKALVWFSQLDFILSTLFLVAKGIPAMGQFGCTEKTLPQRDITRWAGEAHGMNVFSRRLGHFFRRTAPLIVSDAKGLGII